MLGFFVFVFLSAALGFMVFVSHLNHSSASVFILTLTMTSLPVYLSAPLFLVLILNSADPLQCLQHLYTFSLSHTFSTFLSPCLMAFQTPQCLCPLSSVCFILPDFPSASLHHFLWLQRAELNISAASLSKSADYIKSSFAHSIQLQMAHPN